MEVEVEVEVERNNKRRTWIMSPQLRPSLHRSALRCTCIMLLFVVEHTPDTQQ